MNVFACFRVLSFILGYLDNNEYVKFESFVLEVSYRGRVNNSNRECIFTHWKCELIIQIVAWYFKR